MRRRRSLPGGRAVVGGFLMAAAGVGVFGAYAVTTAEPSERYLVTTRDVAAGERFRAGDVVEVALSLPPEQRRVAVGARALDDVLAGVAKASLVAGELLHASDVVNPVGGFDRAQISIPVPATNAFNGSLKVNELVDVIVTYSSGSSAETATVSRAALVVDVITGGGSMGTGGAVTVVLAVRPDEIEAVARAASAGDVTLARVTGVRGTGAGEPSSPPPSSEPPADAAPEPGPSPEPPPVPEPEPAPPEEAAAPEPPAPPPPPPSPSPEPPAPGEPD